MSYPDKKLAHKNFEDYFKEGILEPYRYISKLGYKKINAMGYCIGGHCSQLHWLTLRKII